MVQRGGGGCQRLSIFGTFLMNGPLGQIYKLIFSCENYFDENILPLIDLFFLVDLSWK